MTNRHCGIGDLAASTWYFFVSLWGTAEYPGRGGVIFSGLLLHRILAFTTESPGTGSWK